MFTQQYGVLKRGVLRLSGFMDAQLLLILGAIGIGFVSVYMLLRHELHRAQEPRDDMDALVAWLKSMQTTIDNTQHSVHQAVRGSTADVTKTLQENSRQLNDRLDKASRVIGELQRELGTMTEVGRGIKSLQELLQSPKLRGNIGEHVLKDMIGQAFPKESFHLQYSFSSGTKVDAVLKTDAGLLCIDAKFPLEHFHKMHEAEEKKDKDAALRAFRSDVKKHVDDIAGKYIVVDEGTMDFALMYIPSESIYYEIITDETLTRYAQKKRVYPVSPNTLYAHLQVLLVSFMGKRLEKKSHYVLQLLTRIGSEYEKTEGYLTTLTKHMSNAQNNLALMQQSFGRLGQKIEQAEHLPEDDTHPLPEVV